MQHWTQPLITRITLQPLSDNYRQVTTGIAQLCSWLLLIDKHPDNMDWIDSDSDSSSSPPGISETIIGRPSKPETAREIGPSTPSSFVLAQPEVYSSSLAANLGTIYERTVCPFDPTHTHKAGRHSVDHVFRCRQNHPELAHLVKSCPFNASHWIRVDSCSMEVHLKTCPEFKQWIYTQSVNGAPLSLDPRDLIKKHPKEYDISASGPTPPSLPQARVARGISTPSSIPSFFQNFIMENKKRGATDASTK